MAPGQGPDPPTHCLIPSIFRKCATSKKCDILVHIKGSGEDPR